MFRTGTKGLSRENDLKNNIMKKMIYLIVSILFAMPVMVQNNLEQKVIQQKFTFKDMDIKWD